MPRKIKEPPESKKYIVENIHPQYESDEERERVFEDFVRRGQLIVLDHVRADTLFKKD